MDGFDTGESVQFVWVGTWRSGRINFKRVQGMTSLAPFIHRDLFEPNVLTPNKFNSENLAAEDHRRRQP